MRKGLIAGLILAVFTLFTLFVATPANAAPPGPATAARPGPTAAAVMAPAGDCGTVTAPANHGRLAAAQAGRRTVGCVQATAPRATTTPGMHANVIPAPSWCGNGQWLFNRTDACGVFGWLLTVYEVDQNGDIVGVIGQMDGNQVDYAYTSASISTWAFQVSIQTLGGWGEVVNTQASGTASCSGDCTLRSSNFPTQTVTFGGFVNGDSAYDTTATTPGAVGFATSSYTWRFANSAWAYSVSLTVTPPQVRCDNATPGTGIGCVFPGYVPTMAYSLSGPYAQLAQHIQDAQGSGLPTTLTRVTDPNIQDANRATACPAGYPRPDGFSCDEYPFASTYQGAIFTGGGPRTWDWCQLDIGQPNSTGSSGYSVCMIDAGQNSGGGSVLGSFYSGNRVIDHDPFVVAITP